MSKSKREKFEEQLQALQTDINQLSHKLSVPAAYSASTLNSSTSANSPRKKTVLKEGIWC